jgi:integrase
LRAVLNFAVTQGYLTVNPCSRATRPKIRDQYRAKYLKPAEVRRFLRAAKSSKYEVLYLLGLTCGLRLGEASVVRWSDIDLDKGELHVSRTATLTDAGLREGAPKTPKGRRTIPLTPSVVDAIKSYREASKASPPEGLLFRNETGGIITTSTIRRDLANVCKSASLPQLRFHDLRHSFAHLNINANSLSANAVAYYMGHSDPHLLFLRYGASSELEQTTLRDTMEDLFHDEVRALPSRR